MLKPSTRFVLAVLGVLLAALALAQTPEPLGDDYKLSGEGDFDFEPAMDMDARGNFVVVWERGKGTSYGYDWSIWGRRFASDGTPSTADFRVSEDYLGMHERPDVAMAPDGKFVVVWHRTRPSSYLLTIDVWGRQFDSTGSPASDEFLIGAASDGYNLHWADVDVNPRGDFVVVWQRRKSLERATIQARRFSSAGRELGGEFQVDDNVAKIASFPVVHWTPDGGFLAVWDSVEGGSGQRFSSDGTRIGPPFAFHTSYARGLFNTLDVAASGEFVVAWMEWTDSTFDDTNVFARRFASDATPLSDRFMVNTTTTDRQEWPAVAMERGGEFVVVWGSEYSAGSDNWYDSIQGQRFSSTGERVGEELQLNTTTSNFQFEPTVAARSGEGFVVAWASFEVFEAGLYQSFIRARNFGPTPPFCTAAETVACLNRGRFQVEVEWSDFAGKSGSGHRVPQGSDDSALFWFFGPDNWEVLVKVLDGCAINHRFWVFAATTTNVAYVLRVTDTETGQVREYKNPLGKPADAVTDTAAFATCRSVPSVHGHLVQLDSNAPVLLFC